MSTHPVPAACCPGCGLEVAAATNAERGVDDGPGPGDLTICARCRRFLTFETDMSLVEIAPEDYVKLPLETLASLMRALRLLASLSQKAEEESWAVWDPDDWP